MSGRIGKYTYKNNGVLREFLSAISRALGQRSAKKVIDKITNKAIKQVEKEREGKRRNYFIEMLRYCELVINNVKKYLN